MTEEPYAVWSSGNRLLVFNSQDVTEKTTRSAQGIQVLTLRKGCRMSDLSRLENAGIVDPKLYRARSIPSSGSVIREGTVEARQIGLEGI